MDTGDRSSGDRLRDRFRIVSIWTLNCRLDPCSKGVTATVGGRSSETEFGGSPTRPRWLEEEEPTKETVERQHWNESLECGR